MRSTPRRCRLGAAWELLEALHLDRFTSEDLVRCSNNLPLYGAQLLTTQSAVSILSKMMNRRNATYGAQARRAAINISCFHEGKEAGARRNRYTSINSPSGRRAAAPRTLSASRANGPWRKCSPGLELDRLIRRPEDRWRFLR